MSLTVTRKIKINGKEYHSVDELPPDARALYDAAMASHGKKVTVKKITINGVDVVESRSSATTIAVVVFAVLAAITFLIFRAS
jgi:hypothetical protein